jgi:hypothetical protein
VNESPITDDGKRKSGFSYSDALIMAKAETYGAAIERGEYQTEQMIEEKVAARAREIMREHN